jgi:DNA-binding NtrC family response regulator
MPFSLGWHSACHALAADVLRIGIFGCEVMILVVEDDPLARRALKSLFVANGYPCLAVNSAEDALSALGQADMCGIALIDIDLPGMSGLQLLGRLRELHPKLSCTLMSANDYDPGNISNQNRVPFFTKPLDLKRLLGFLGNAAAAHGQS